MKLANSMLIVALACATTTNVITAFVIKPAETKPQAQVFVATSTEAEHLSSEATIGSQKEESFPQKLQNFEKYWGELSHERPGYAKHFWALRAAVRKEDGPLDLKTKELINLALSVAGTCDTCIAHHVYDALEAGATREEIADALGCVALMNGGVGVAFATHAMRAVDEFEEMMKEE